MTTPFDCALGGVLLSSLDERICVLDIRENAPKLHLNIAAAPVEGLHVVNRRRESLTVQVEFAIHEEKPIRRRAVLQSVCAWAAEGGVLTINDRPGQQLTVICSRLPAMASDDWTEKLTLAFTTTAIPYWEDINFTQVSATEETTFTVPGTADFTPASAMIVNIGDAPITNVSLRCGDTQMVFDGISLPVNTMLVVTHLNGLLSAKISGKSVLNCRTADSSDALLAPCGGECTVSAEADQALNALFMVRGRYA